jgi:hypothetical protein
MEFDGFPLDPSPTDVDQNGGAADEEDVADYWNGIPMSSAEMAEEMNAVQRGETPRPASQLKEMSEEDQRMMEAMEPSDVSMNYPWGPLFPEEDEHLRRGIRETMFDTLPEMEIIIENECIM